ncbi:Cytochrome P450 monooxygenase claM [Psilocybe cubensis]|uniref:Cytochrome P450 monooxygenase claM n=2 Tax=Psilocybe cubensis TaxID=181762 RepID=A0ACB8GUH5_PSICU|nr:Cytochrome P450 monooxygenase claM [Psilocybe cubensis]KAH9478669.1 Cytochrome P450 monooxygenase claM [Psilocybe cubensis]
MPYSVGLQSAAAAFLSAGFATQFTVAVIVFLVIVSVTSALQKEGADAPKSLPGYSIFHIIPFFRKRHDFLNWGFQITGQNVFQFMLLRNTVVVVSGETARQTFFTAKGLDLTEGFKILSGAIPMVKGVTSDLQTRRIALIHKRLANVQRNGSLSSLIPYLLEDTRKIMEGWGTSGKFDPFENVYELTIRSLSCVEISNDPALVARLKVLYDTLDTGTTPATVLLPWLPTPAMIKKLWATKEIYEIVIKAINDRESSGISRNDTLQMLLDSGDEKLVVVGFIMGLLIAGARATGTTASWLMTYLGGHPEWRAKAAAEVESLLASRCYSPENSPTRESPTSFFSSSTTTSLSSLSARLGTIPLEVWETETPVLDALIRETTRVAQPHTAMRRNLGPELYINNKIIPTGAYVIYPFSDVHLDPEIYPDPWKFDPSRKEPAHIPFSYVGWGGGKTLCLGTRLAKVELKLITAMFVLGFQHTVVDRRGEPSNPLPVPNWNDILLCRPPAGSFKLKYERTSVRL